MRKWNDLFWFLDFFRHRPNFHQRLTKSMTILHKAKAPLPPFLFHLSILWIFIRDVCQKKTGKCGNFEKTGGGGLPKSHFFCNLTKWFFAYQNHSEVLEHVLQKWIYLQFIPTSTNQNTTQKVNIFVETKNVPKVKCKICGDQKCS